MLSYYRVFFPVLRVYCCGSCGFTFNNISGHSYKHCTGESLKLSGQSLTSMQPLKIQIFFLAVSIGEQHLKS